MYCKCILLSFIFRTFLIHQTHLNELVQNVKPGKIVKVDDRDANSCYAILSEVMGNITFHGVWQNTCFSPWFLKPIYYSIVVIGIIEKPTSSLTRGRLSFCWDKLQHLAAVNRFGLTEANDNNAVETNKRFSPTALFTFIYFQENTLFLN
jgi:hypothetical protein